MMPKIQKERLTADNQYTNLWVRPGFLIRRLHQIHVGMFLQECGEFDVTPVQFGILCVLYEGVALDQNSVATKIGVDRNTAADVIRRLSRRGLVSQMTNENDRRAKIAQITEEGKRIVERVHPLMTRSQERFVEPLTQTEVAQLHHLLEKLLVANNDAGRTELQP